MREFASNSYTAKQLLGFKTGSGADESDCAQLETSEAEMVQGMWAPFPVPNKVCASGAHDARLEEWLSESVVVGKDRRVRTGYLIARDGEACIENILAINPHLERTEAAVL